jgi:hypothetical protein
MNIDIEANLRQYCSAGMGPTDRDVSYDYCFNYFQSFREVDRLGELTGSSCIEMSCLQLGFYLASWGMLRGSAFLLRKSVKVFVPVIEAIADAEPALWEIDAHCYTATNIELVLGFKRKIIEAFGSEGRPTDTLVTKIMLGVFGNVPAFDTDFLKGLTRYSHRRGAGTFGKAALKEIARFYEENKPAIDGYHHATLDFATEQPTNRRYTQAKVIDMILVAEGRK